MNIFIDKPNLLSVIRSAKKENYNDCMRMLKDNFTIFFTFAKKDILSLGQNDKQDAMQWLTQMASGINSTNKEPIRWESIFHCFLTHSNIQKTSSTKSTLGLIWINMSLLVLTL